MEYERNTTGMIIYKYKYKEIIYKQSYALPESASVFQAELEAIRQAARFFNINKLRCTAKYIQILVDSQAALKALSSKDIQSETVNRTIT